MEGEFKPWELKSSPVSLGYWSKKENRVYAVKDLIENVLKFDDMCPHTCDFSHE